MSLPDRQKLRTLAEAVAWLAKEIPKSEQKMEKAPSRGRPNRTGPAPIVKTTGTLQLTD
jgi:hypothetical protein